MGTERYDTSVKTNVSTTVKKALQNIADARHLDLSDVTRDAFREYLERNPVRARKRQKVLQAA